MIAFCFLLGACSGGKVAFPRSPLAEQILRPRAGSEGKLTNSNCSKYKGDTCLGFTLLSYDLNDPAIRRALNEFKFACRIGERIFHICSEKPGFCRREFSQKCFLGICGERKLVKEDFIPISDYKFLIDADTVCISQGDFSNIFN